MRARPLVLLSLLFACGGAAAAPLEPRGPILGLRIGLGAPHGDVVEGGPALDDVVEWTLPITLDVGYRFSRRFWGEFFLSGAPSSAASPLCAGDASCSATDVRFGVAIQLRLAPSARLDPWVGVGAGLELLHAEGDDPGTGASSEWTWVGLEVPVEAGLDLALGDRFSLGPYVSATAAQFTSASVRPAGQGRTTDAVDERATHGWLAAGVKATLRL